MRLIKSSTLLPGTILTSAHSLGGKMKVCSKCKVEKPKSDFSIDRSRNDGLNYRCKECVKEHDAQKYLKHRNKILARSRQWFEDNPEYSEQYYIKNRKKIRSQGRQWYSKNKDKQSLKARQNRRRNPKKARAQGKRWRDSHPEYFERLDVRITNALRGRLYSAIKGGYKAGSAVQDLGCPIKEFKEYIAKQFEPWMSWDNWAHDTWHLDHKVPLASFDLTNREELLKAVHYTNFQPLSAQENLAKGADIQR